MVGGGRHSGMRLPEGTPLLHAGGNGGVDLEAQSRRTFTAASQRRRVPLWAWAAGLIVLGTLALYLLGAMPGGGSATSWIRSRPRIMHNPAAQLPDLVPEASKLTVPAAQQALLDKHVTPTDPVSATDDAGGSSGGDSNATPQAAADFSGGEAAGKHAAAPAAAPNPSADAADSQAKQSPDHADAEQQPADAAEPQQAPHQAQQAEQETVSAADADDAALSPGEGQPEAPSGGDEDKHNREPAVDDDAGQSPASAYGEVAAVSAAAPRSDKGDGIKSKPADAKASPSRAGDDSSSSQADEKQAAAAQAGGGDGDKPDTGKRSSQRQGVDKSRSHAPASNPSAGSSSMEVAPKAKRKRPAIVSKHSNGAAQQQEDVPVNDYEIADFAATEAGGSEPPQPPSTGRGKRGHRQPVERGGGSGKAATVDADAISSDGGVAVAANQKTESKQPEAKETSNTAGSGGKDSGSRKPGAKAAAGADGMAARQTGSSKGGTGGGKTSNGGGGKPAKKKAKPEPAAGSGSADDEAEQRGAAQLRREKDRETLATEAVDEATEAACLGFAPAGCAVIPGKVKPLQYPNCDVPPDHNPEINHKCTFDEEQAMAPCPLPSAGLYFSRRAPAGGCKTPLFWRETGEEPPSCSDKRVCCSGDGISGTWKPSKEIGHAVDFKEDKSMGCRYHHYTRRQVLGCLADMNVVFWGDSMVRQIFNRIPSMFRGEPRTFESNRWRAERYDVCEAADANTLAPSVDYYSPKDYHYCQWGLSNITDSGDDLLSFDEVPRTELVDMLDPDAMPKDFPADTCGRTRPVGFQFIPATGFWPTYRFMTPFMEHHKDLSKAVFLTHVGFWDNEAEVPTPQYLDTLDRALSQGLNRMVVLLIATKMVGIDEGDRRRKLFRDRSDHMRAWAAKDTTGRVDVIDFDSLSLAPNAPMGLIGNWTDWHYSCKFQWYHDLPRGVNETGAEIAQQSSNWIDPGGYTLGSLHANDRLDCVDDMNRMVLQVLFNLLCNKRDGGGGNGGGSDGDKA